MSKQKKTDKRSVLVDARPSAFRVRTKDRADRLVAACKPITDVWYPRFRDAMQQGTDALMETYETYRMEVLATATFEEDEIFRYASLQMILKGIYCDWMAEETGPVSASTIATINLIRSDNRWYIKCRNMCMGEHFNHETAVFNLADSIDTLGLEYKA